MNWWQTILVAFLTINAVFWSLFDHGTHCKVAARLGVRKCPSHWVHILSGAVFFLLAVLTSQWSYIFRA